MTDDDPVATLLAWIDEAQRGGDAFADAMALATATPDGVPSVRMVLLRGIVDGQLRFFTCYDSPKARELDRNPRAALAFHWKSLERQVRIEGTVERLSAADSDAYFASRPRGSQLSASVSPQSQPIESLAVLEQAREKLAAELAGGPVPRPENWGGFGLRPTMVELWVGGGDRLHLRRRFQRAGEGWVVDILAP